MYNVVDSSGWLEFFANGANAAAFEVPIDAVADLIVPTIAIYEVFKALVARFGAARADQALAVMLQGRVVDLDTSLALEAVKMAASNKLAMADAIILATARRFGATLWTQDADFAGIDGVRYLLRPD